MDPGVTSFQLPDSLLPHSFLSFACFPSVLDGAVTEEDLETRVCCKYLSQKFFPGEPIGKGVREARKSGVQARPRHSDAQAMRAGRTL